MNQSTGHSQAKNAIIAILQLVGAALLLFFALATPTVAEDAPREISGAKTVDFKGVIDLLSTVPGVVVVDNRKQPDFNSGHIDGAVNIPDTDMSKESLSDVGAFTSTNPFLLQRRQMRARCKCNNQSVKLRL
jgi:Rhodanese-like domain